MSQRDAGTLVTEIVINSRDKDVNDGPLKPDFDDMYERVLNRERR